MFCEGISSKDEFAQPLSSLASRSCTLPALPPAGLPRELLFANGVSCHVVTGPGHVLHVPGARRTRAIALRFAAACWTGDPPAGRLPRGGDSRLFERLPAARRGSANDPALQAHLRPASEAAWGTWPGCICRPTRCPTWWNCWSPSWRT